MRFSPAVQGAAAALVRKILGSVLQTPALRDLHLRLERGGALSLGGVHPGAQPFLVFVLSQMFPERTILAVAEGVKAQELLQQDLETWCTLATAQAEASKVSPL